MTGLSFRNSFQSDKEKTPSKGSGVFLITKTSVMCQADGCHSFWQVVPCPVEGSQFAVVGILLGDIDSFIVSYAAKMKIDSFLCSNLDRKIRFFVGKAIRPMTSNKNL